MDLEALKAAALATLKVKPRKVVQQDEDTNLIALREAALRSKKAKASALSNQHGCNTSLSNSSLSVIETSESTAGSDVYHEPVPRESVPSKFRRYDSENGSETDGSTVIDIDVDILSSEDEALAASVSEGEELEEPVPVILEGDIDITEFDLDNLVTDSELDLEAGASNEMVPQEDESLKFNNHSQERLHKRSLRNKDDDYKNESSLNQSKHSHREAREKRRTTHRRDERRSRSPLRDIDIGSRPAANRDSNNESRRHRERGVTSQRVSRKEVKVKDRISVRSRISPTRRSHQQELNSRREKERSRSDGITADNEKSSQDKLTARQSKFSKTFDGMQISNRTIVLSDKKVEVDDEIKAKPKKKDHNSESKKASLASRLGAQKTNSGDEPVCLVNDDNDTLKPNLKARLGGFVDDLPLLKKTSRLVSVDGALKETDDRPVIPRLSRDSRRDSTVEYKRRSRSPFRSERNRESRRRYADGEDASNKREKKPVKRRISAETSAGGTDSKVKKTQAELELDVKIEMIQAQNAARLAKHKEIEREKLLYGQ